MTPTNICNKIATVAAALLVAIAAGAQLPERTAANVEKYKQVCRKNICGDMRGMYRKAGGALKYPFLAPGSEQYADILWDWDSWLSDVSLRQVLTDIGTAKDFKEALPYEQGCVLNSLSYGGMDGWIPFWIERNQAPRDTLLKQINPWKTNMHKPTLAQHAAFLVSRDGGDAEWLREDFYKLQSFVNKYWNYHRNKATGLIYWENDVAIGVDNDPSTFFRPDESSGSIFLNSLMYKELQAMEYLAQRLKLTQTSNQYKKMAEELKASIQKYCWDPRDRSFYSVDFDLKPVSKPDIKGVKPGQLFFHSGQPRSYDCLIMRFSVWSSFMPMWAGIATPEEAKEMVERHYRNKEEFNCAAGIYTLSPMEKMFDVRASGNPSSWQGPTWIVANYLVFRGLVKYGFNDDARELAEKTVILLGRDFERFGALHEYYEPDSGEPVLNKGFQNWNYLVLNMIDWLDGKTVVSEF